MKMAMTNGNMATYISVMEKLKEEKKLGFAIACNLRTLRETAKEFLDFRASLYEKYGKVDKITGTASLDPSDPEKIDAFLEEINEIAPIEREVDIVTVTPEVFMNGTLDSTQMDILMWMVEKPKEEIKEDKVDG